MANPFCCCYNDLTIKDFLNSKDAENGIPQDMRSDAADIFCVVHNCSEYRGMCRNQET